MAYTVDSVRRILEGVMIENKRLRSDFDIDYYTDLGSDTYDLLLFLFENIEKNIYNEFAPYDVSVGVPKNHVFTEGASHLFPREIKDYISKSGTRTYTYKIKIGERLITADLVYFMDDAYNMAPDEIMKLINCWMVIATTNLSPTCSRNLHIQLFLTNFKKQLQSDNSSNEDIDPINPINVNSAFTTSCSEDTSIIIYRSEEWFKVFIHETFHCLGLDFSHVQHDCTSKLSKHFHFQGIDYKLYESYCETWARIINVCFSAFLSLPKSISHKGNRKHERNGKGKGKGKGLLDTDKDIIFLEYTSLFSYYMMYETKFSFIQLNKVLTHHNTDYNEVIDTSSSTTGKSVRDNRKQRGGAPSTAISKYKENTAVVSYFVISGILMSNYQSFISWCSIHHKPGSNIFHMNDSNRDIESYCDLIIKLSKKKEFRDFLSYLKREVSKTPSSLRYSDMMMSYIPLPYNENRNIKIIVK
jgi:hypothetical protein